MSSYAIATAAIAAVAFYAAWREYAGRNRRDAALIAAFGVGLLFVSGVLVRTDLS